MEENYLKATVKIFGEKGKYAFKDKIHAYLEAEQAAFDAAGLTVGTVEFTCPICSGKAIGVRYEHSGSIHGLGSGCTLCSIRHT